MTLQTPAQACAALAVLMAGADEIGTMEERRYLFETIAAHPVFADLDRAGFMKLMRETTDWIWSSLPTEGARVAEEGIAAVVELIRDVVPVEYREDAIRAAVGLADADGVTSEEASLIERLSAELEVDPAMIR